MANKTKECAAALAWTQREQVVKVQAKVQHRHRPHPILRSQTHYVLGHNKLEAVSLGEILDREFELPPKDNSFHMLSTTAVPSLRPQAV